MIYKKEPHSSPRPEWLCQFKIQQNLICHMTGPRSDSFISHLLLSIEPLVDLQLRWPVLWPWRIQMDSWVARQWMRGDRVWTELVSEPLHETSNTSGLAVTNEHWSDCPSAPETQNKTSSCEGPFKSVFLGLKHVYLMMDTRKRSRRH